MKRTITISGIECKFKSSAAIPRIYRLKYGRDIFVDMVQIQKKVEAQERQKKALKKQYEKEGKTFEENDFSSGLPLDSLEMFENIAYIMHKHGDKEQPDTIEEWLDQFETFDIYQILPEIVEMWNLENRQMSEAKKKIGK